MAGGFNLAMNASRRPDALQRFFIAPLQQAVDSRKWIERANGILMRRAGFTENEALRRPQPLSRQKNMKMTELAELIVTAEDAMS
jgi:two-component system, response regulator PdtaR